MVQLPTIHLELLWPGWLRTKINKVFHNYKLWKVLVVKAVSRSVSPVMNVSQDKSTDHPRCNYESSSNTESDDGELCARKCSILCTCT